MLVTLHRIAAALVATALIGYTTLAHGAAAFKIVTASERGTYIQIGQDLARYIAPLADIQLDALPSAGSAENVRRLRYEPGVKLALVQSDVYQAFLDQAAAGNAQARDLIQPLRVVMPLYNEEIYFVVRADSPLNYVHDIRGLRISAGPVGSGTALTTTTLYKLMFNEPLADANATFQSNEDGLAKLVTDRSVDVVAIIAGQPAKLLTDMKPESRKYVKLLRFDPNACIEPGGIADLFPGDGARSELSEPADRGPARARGEGLSRHVRLQPRQHARLSAALCTFDVPQFLHPAIERPSEMARGRHRAA